MGGHHPSPWGGLVVLKGLTLDVGFSAACLQIRLGGGRWAVGEWSPTAPPSLPVGVGHFWVPGFPENLGLCSLW